MRALRLIHSYLTNRKQRVRINGDYMKLFQWFSDNQTKANLRKCHLLVSGKNNVTIDVSGFEVTRD